MKVDVGYSIVKEETDSKISRVEQLRTSYRWLHNELKITLKDRYEAEKKLQEAEKKLQAMKNTIKYVQSLKAGMSERYVSVSIDFPLNSKRDAPFHHIAYDHSRAH